MPRDKIFYTNCGDIQKRGTKRELQKFYEGLGFQAEREKDYRKMHFYWQYSEHYKRVQYER